MPPLTPDEIALLQIEGVGMLRTIAGRAAGAVSWGMYFVVFAFAVHCMGKRQEQTRAWKAMLGISIVLFSMSSTILVLGLFSDYNSIKKAYLSPDQWTKTAHDRDLSSLAGSVPVNYAANWIFSLEVLIGDAIVIWRTWVLWRGNLACYLPIILWITSLVMTIAERVDFVTSGGYAEQVRSLAGQGQVVSLSLPAFALSVATNAVSTSMIAYKAWKYRQSVKQALGATASSKVERIFALLVESGMIYLFFWSTSIFINIPDEASKSKSFDIFFGVWAANRGPFVGLYPTLIIVIIELQQTMKDTLSRFSTVSLSPSTLTTSAVYTIASTPDSVEDDRGTNNKDRTCPERHPPVDAACSDGSAGGI